MFKYINKRVYITYEINLSREAMGLKLFKSEKFIHIMTVISGLYIAYYVYWRAAFTINESALFFSIVLLIAEIQGVINFILFAMMTWNVKTRKSPKKLKSVSVDVFVPTYNEDISVLEATLVGCNNMRMDHKTYLLDDGRRPEVEELARRMGCGYLTREDNKHAKAGNINAALKKTDGDLIVVLDADMVPQPDFLEKTTGYFRKKKTAIVQLPQEFYNLDSMQHQSQDSNWHEQQLFYHVIQPGKNNINAAFWCGSPSIVRREALEEIGGVATDSITEDFLTSIRLNSKGWKIKYHHEALAFGIAPQSFDAFSVQRLRWAQGSMKILRSGDNPLIKKGLSFRQRLSHFAAIFTYFDAYQKMIYLLTPVILLFTGIMPIKVLDPIDFVLHWVPYFGLSMLTNTLLGRGYFNYLEVEKFNTLKMVTFIKASFSLVFGRNNKFKVTPKSVEQTVKQKERRELSIHLAILILIVVAVMFAVLNSLIRQIIQYPSLAALLIAIFWSLINGVILFLSVYEVFKRAYLRKDYRFPLSLEGNIKTKSGYSRKSCHVSNISRGGLNVICEDAGLDLPEKGSITEVQVKLPTGYISVPAQTMYTRNGKDGRQSLGFKFEEMDENTRMKLYRFLFVTAPRKIYEEHLNKAAKKKLRIWHVFKRNRHVNQNS